MDKTMPCLCISRTGEVPGPLQQAASSLAFGTVNSLQDYRPKKPMNAMQSTVEGPDQR